MSHTRTNRQTSVSNVGRLAPRAQRSYDGAARPAVDVRFSGRTQQALRAPSIRTQRARFVATESARGSGVLKDESARRFRQRSPPPPAISTCRKSARFVHPQQLGYTPNSQRSFDLSSKSNTLWIRLMQLGVGEFALSPRSFKLLLEHGTMASYDQQRHANTLANRTRRPFRC